MLFAKPDVLPARNAERQWIEVRFQLPPRMARSMPAVQSGVGLCA